VAGNILTAWVLTFPAAGTFAAVVYWVLRLVFRLP
jgi:phosphate/sulfate permease